MRFSPRWAGLAATLGLLLSAGTAAEAGTIVTYNFTGLAGTDPFTGSFSYDLSTPDLSPGSSGGTYGATAAFPITLTVTYKGVTTQAVPTAGTISIFDAPGPGVDEFLLTTNATDGTFLSIDLLDFTGTAFTSDALPTSLDLSSFKQATFISPGLNIGGNLTSLELAAAGVPEPSTLASLGVAGLIGLVARFRCRRVLARS